MIASRGGLVCTVRRDPATVPSAWPPCVVEAVVASCGWWGEAVVMVCVGCSGVLCMQASSGEPMGWYDAKVLLFSVFHSCRQSKSTRIVFGICSDWNMQRKSRAHRMNMEDCIVALILRSMQQQVYKRIWLP